MKQIFNKNTKQFFNFLNPDDQKEILDGNEKLNPENPLTWLEYYAHGFFNQDSTKDLLIADLPLNVDQKYWVFDDKKQTFVEMSDSQKQEIDFVQPPTMSEMVSNTLRYLKSEGKVILEEFLTKNVLMGISNSQVNLLVDPVKPYSRMTVMLESGAFPTLLEYLETLIIEPDLQNILTSERIEELKNKIKYSLLRASEL